MTNRSTITISPNELEHAIRLWLTNSQQDIKIISVKPILETRTIRKAYSEWEEPFLVEIEVEVEQ
jgi:hypothetical protein